MNNINCVLEQKNNCCGCRACANICPVSAITMQEDEEGFFRDKLLRPILTGQYKIIKISQHNPL